VLVLGLLGIQVMRPERTNPVSPSERHLASRLPMTPEAAAVFERSCRDCHSNETRWPWYSQIAPTSWFVVNHVNHARSHLNVSEWDRYEPRKAAHHLEEMCENARDRKMPLPSYLWIHRGARPSEADIEALCAWTETAGASLHLSERDDH